MQKIIILDFGSQVTQLIARSIRELNVYCEIIPYHATITPDANIKGIILSGSPASVNQENAPMADIAALIQIAPILGICYGAQLTAKVFGGVVENSDI
jgi:GMP synthase (glutamine-hydrolysing)